LELTLPYITVSVRKLKNLLIFAILLFPTHVILGSSNMSDPVFVVSEWLPKADHDQELWALAKEIMSLTLENEKGCLRAHAWRQIAHPGAPGTSKYTIVLHQAYENMDAFNAHCESEYVTNFFKRYVANGETSIVEDWTCRLFSEDGTEKQ
jgi:quinol monooxygenase YgiN